MSFLRLDFNEAFKIEEVHIPTMASSDDGIRIDKQNTGE